MYKIVGIALCAVAPTSFALTILEDWLLGSGVLNTKDMPPFVGDDGGTLSEYLLNVWHWDGAVFLLMIAAVP
jgi:hypothetical protein